jgi:hypothetical protein
LAAATADNLQLPAWELEVESEPEPSGETISVRSPINNQVNNSGSRKILLALAASLGGLVLGTGAAPPTMRSGNETLKQGKILAVETQNAAKSTDVNLLLRSAVARIC